MRRLLAAATALILAAGVAAAGDWKKLLTPDDLAALSDSATVIDIRSPSDYAAGHVPGALNAPYGTWRGPTGNPGAPLSDARLTALLQGLGLTPDSRAVVTHAGRDATDFGAAARVYWTLKSAGLGEIAILNGGVGGWVAAGEPLSVEPARAEPSDARFTLSSAWRIDRAGVAEIVAGTRAATLIDARPDAFRSGDAKHPAARTAGTLEGSAQLVYETWFAEDPTEMALADRVKALAADVPGQGGETVSFCNTGHWAAINWFALSEMAGRDDVKLYPESMVGWVNSGGPATTLK